MIKAKTHSIFIAITTFGLMFFNTIAISDSQVGNSVPEILNSDLCKDNPVVVEEKTYQDYQVKISSAGDGDCHLLDIERQGKVLYHDEEIGGHFYFGADFEKGVDPFVRLTGQNDPNLVFSKWTGGAHCCFSLHVFELDKDLREIANVDGGNFYPVLEDIDHDGIAEIRVTDDALAYLFSSFASSAAGDVVLKYSNHEYRVAAEYMVKTAPELDIFNKKIKTWRKMLRKHAPDWPPPSLIQTVTDLFYTGNARAAFALVDRTWPSDVAGKEDFLKAYEEVLEKSRYYQEFQKQI